MNKLERQQVIKRESLNEQHYFQAVLQEIENKKLLSDTELDNIKMQCIQLLGKHIESYTGGENSSVKVEKAHNIMLSIFYCVGVYLKSLPEPDNCIKELREKTLIELYKSGRVLVNEEIESSKKLLDAVRKNRVETNNRAYNDTIIDEEGIEGFFPGYDADFAAHDSISGSIDYPLCNDKMDLAGVECIHSYLYKLFIENEFCKNYCSEDINGILKGYNDNYEDLLINIFERVLTNALGSILAGKTALELDIYPKELNYLQKKLDGLSKEELEMHLNWAAKKLCCELNILNSELQQYILMSLKAISTNLYNAMQNDQLQAVFINIKAKTQKAQMKFQDGEKMDDELFRKIVKEISECRFAADKIAIVQENIHSIIDLVDILEGECIFEKEYKLLFESLGDMELALLLKVIPSNEDEDTVFEEQWEKELMDYLNIIDYERSKSIKKIYQTIELN